MGCIKEQSLQNNPFLTLWTSKACMESFLMRMDESPKTFSTCMIPHTHWNHFKIIRVCANHKLPRLQFLVRGVSIGTKMGPSFTNLCWICCLNFFEQRQVMEPHHFLDTLMTSLASLTSQIRSSSFYFVFLHSSPCPGIYMEYWSPLA